MNLHQATLPIEFHDGLIMSGREARAIGEMLQADYVSADPFPHIVIDNILPDGLVRKILENFPAKPIASDVNFEIGYGGQFKRQVMPEDCNPFSRELFHFFNSMPVLQFLEGLTGVPKLLPDPYYEGGGFHETSRGGLLGIHADFRINERLNLQRRMNLLIYLNETWDDSWKGQLELWDREMKQCVTRVSPILNRCVVFNTDATSWHGHPDALQVPDGVKRRSMALYYYTASDAVYREVPARDTMYQARPGDSNAVHREAAAFRRWQYLNDWLPPVAMRFVHKVRHRLSRQGA
jgi:hypothetical protein